VRRAIALASDFNHDLILRSRATRGVSKGGQQQDWFPSFETHAFGVLLRMRR